MSPDELQEQVKALFHRAVEAAGRTNSDQAQPSLQLFAREARILDGIRFQLAHVSQLQDGRIVLQLLAVQISGQIESTRVLFFQWKSLPKATINVQRFQLTLQGEVFDSVTDLVAQRIAAYVPSYIAALET